MAGLKAAGELQGCVPIALPLPAAALNPLSPDTVASLWWHRQDVPEAASVAVLAGDGLIKFRRARRADTVLCASEPLCVCLKKAPSV